jgi:hypothetical protein
MVHDAVVADLSLKQLIDKCLATGLVVFRTTRLQRAQLARISPENDVGQATAIDAEQIGLSMFFCGWSQAGVDRLGGPDTHAAFMALRKDNPKDSADALIGITALTDADILVTEDKRFGNRFKNLKTRVTVMTVAEFKAHLRDLLATNCANRSEFGARSAPPTASPASVTPRP